MKKNFLIVGGTSGVGLELARQYVDGGHHVTITGRNDPDLAGAGFQRYDVTGDANRLARDTDALLEHVKVVHTLVYCAGFRQHGHLYELADDELGAMTNVGLLAPMLLIQRLKRRSDWPLKIMVITSGSQYEPSELEPAYCAAKAGLGMLAASLARDGKIGKVLVAAPSDIDTPFWRNSDGTGDAMLDPQWVARQIVDLSGGAFKYKHARLLRRPARVEVVECLDNNLSAIDCT
ncbi:MAG: SDR family oxidoreductase [Pseudomonadota bacterium]